MTGVYHGTCELHPLVQLARNHATKGGLDPVQWTRVKRLS